MFNNKVKYFLLIFSLVLSVMIFCSCNSKTDGKSDSSSGVQQGSSSKDLYDFSGLASQKYAEIFAGKDPQADYTLRWHYSIDDKEPVNFICCSRKTNSWALKMTPPLFSENNFIVKDKKLIDLYEKDKKYFETDMVKEAESMGFFSYEEFERYVCDIFAGMYYLGSSEEELDGVKMSCDTFFTDKQAKLKFYIGKEGELYAIEPVRNESNERIFMYIDEFSESADDSAFRVPSGYRKEEISDQ